MKKIGLITLLSLSSSMAFASDDVGYNAAVKYRNFGASKGALNVAENIVPGIAGGSNIFPSVSSLGMSYFSNVGRTFQDSIGYGDWDKLYRVSFGYEYDYINSKNTKSSYGLDAGLNNFYVTADKKITDSVRLGAGVSFASFNTDYMVKDMYLNQQNVMSSFFMTYNENNTKWLSLLYLGVGTSDLRRVSDVDVHKSNFLTMYYGFENTASKDFNFNNFYARPVLDFNYYGVLREGFVENNGFDLSHHNAYKIDFGTAFYVGYKNNKFDVRVGPDFTTILSDPRKAYTLDYYDGSSLEIAKNTADKHYLTWRANFSYKMTDDFSFVSDFRYYEKESHSKMFTLGLNYKF
ncbi:MAG: hypothetical protein R3Y43_00130 [Alphaproteobacteria bacterium]